MKELCSPIRQSYAQIDGGPLSLAGERMISLKLPAQIYNRSRNKKYVANIKW